MSEVPLQGHRVVPADARSSLPDTVESIFVEIIDNCSEQKILYHPAIQTDFWAKAPLKPPGWLAQREPRPQSGAPLQPLIIILMDVTV